MLGVFYYYGYNAIIRLYCPGTDKRRIFRKKYDLSETVFFHKHPLEKANHPEELGKWSRGIERNPAKVWSRSEAYALSIFKIYFSVIFREKLKIRL